MTKTKKVETELSKLKAKCLKDGSPKKGATGPDLARLKQLQDAEPLSKAELEEAGKREEERKQKDIDDYKARKDATTRAEQTGIPEEKPDKALDVPQPAEHPRITAIKQALMPFTQLEVHDSRPDEFILINRGTAITAGDVRTAKKAMKI
jgi:hypothetical protein